MLINMKQFWN